MDIRPFEMGDFDEILGLYESVGWTNYTRCPDMLKNAFEHSLRIYAAYDQDTLIGLIRAVGDGYSIVFIQDLLVNPHYQRQAIGTKLIHKLLNEYSDSYQMHLITQDSPETDKFYRSVGLTPIDEKACRAYTKYYGG